MPSSSKMKQQLYIELYDQNVFLISYLACFLAIYYRSKTKATARSWFQKSRSPWTCLSTWGNNSKSKQTVIWISAIKTNCVLIFSTFRMESLNPPDSKKVRSDLAEMPNFVILRVCSCLDTSSKVHDCRKNFLSSLKIDTWWDFLRQSWLLAETKFTKKGSNKKRL